ncbi:MAG TPA: alpha/beta fold hydrolase [Microvirga sp.]|jgi:pimeloyl-ACP methyl ester carboxylesterase|nr:alpha/beta fold hydrolase [Microvirga sp.]
MPDRPRLRVVEADSRDGIRIATRRIAAEGRAPALEIVEARPAGPTSGAPVLFVHGAFGGAWMWREVFLPHLARRGRHAAAVSLRAHGGSGGYEALQTWGLGDFVEDVRRAHAAMPAIPILVGHSLGGLLLQMLVGRLSMRAIVLLASLPPEGLFFDGPRLAVTDPQIWSEAYFGSVSGAKLPVEAAGYQILFSEGLPPAQVAAHAARMVPESPRALLEAHAPGPIVPAILHGIPTLVVSGDNDRLVWRPSAIRTALYHGGLYRMAPDMGHFLQLDVGAEEVARTVLDWIETLP